MSKFAATATLVVIGFDIDCDGTGYIYQRATPREAAAFRESRQVNGYDYSDTITLDQFMGQVWPELDEWERGYFTDEKYITVNNYR